MGRSAAVFDLDRTLLAGSSTPVINDALFEVGLTSRRSIPGQGLMMQLYRLAGESLPSMALARVAALTMRGKPVADAVRAADIAADRLVRDILPYAYPLLAWHRDHGRLLLLATTTPADLVRPLAERLGFDDVVATRWGRAVDRHGVERYTGGVEGGFVWALGKLVAVRRWAEARDVSLGDSWAYSDSVYDLPLLEAVGHPTAINPDPRLLAAAALQRWPVVHLDAPPGVPKLLGAELIDVVKLLTPCAVFPYARFDIVGREHIPRRGAAIVAANHRSYFDPVPISRAIFDAGRRPRAMAKKELFDAPLIGPLLRASGGICVDRDEDPTAALFEAEAALRAGELIAMTPQGTIPRGQAFFEARLTGKTGAARLAAATGAPVIPVGIWGSELVWPRSSRRPHVTQVLSPPVVRVRIGPPVGGLTGADARTDTERIMSAVSDLLPAAAHIRRIPTPAELALTQPAR